jgi:hypothetical protein
MTNIRHSGASTDPGHACDQVNTSSRFADIVMPSPNRQEQVEGVSRGDHARSDARPMAPTQATRLHLVSSPISAQAWRVNNSSSLPPLFCGVARPLR